MLFRSEPLRLVKYWDEEQEREFTFITNAMHISALQVAELYKNRWQVELFFKLSLIHICLVINVSLKEFRGICERDYPKIEAYLGLKKYLLRTFGVTLNIHSQKTKSGSDKNTAITLKQ